LIRLLINHPAAEIVFAHSESNAGNLITDVHAGLYGETELRFTDQLPFDEVDVVFFCFGHGKSTQFIQEHYIPADVRIIDLAQDFRLASEDHDYVYGLPELNRERIEGALHVANPGCFATCIQLALLPLAEAELLQNDISVNAITGSTGAGVKPAATTHFSWRSGNMSIYKAFHHQHVPEIKQSLQQLLSNFCAEIDFIPYRGGFARGIFATIVVKCDLDIETLYKLYEHYYDRDSFTHIVNTPVDLKQVVNTNKCLIHLEKHGNKLLITSVIDNLLKGASGQAVHNMNLLFGLAETVGLQLKPSAF
jgi:N-acetyl-gamma-glutamyl-phosphate reductase